MFAGCGNCWANSGTAEIEGSKIPWVKDAKTGAITLTVIEADGSTTTIEIPGSGNFNF